MKILVMGLPGSGKTYLAKRMQPILNAAWYNADIVREMANDWDFSPEGRIRQSLRMKNLADLKKNMEESLYAILYVLHMKQKEILIQTLLYG